ncbi:AAA family ATPase [Streptomyces sp. NPDC051976]|uniref:ATP-binding protein n=1 Tax=Streptomyces sp. NPDC051976 TaxID=3154947 RepID=UPI003429E924
MAGRERELGRFETTLSRLEAGRSANTPFLTGSRGSGKTSLFNAMTSRAKHRGWYVGAEAAIPDTPLPALIALLAHDVLLAMSARHRAVDRVKRAMGILKAFTSVSVAGIRLDINSEAVTGTADSGILELDLRRLFTEIGEIAQAQSVGVLFALDEVHVLGNDELRVLDSALHRSTQRQLPVAFLGAGLFPSWQGTGLHTFDPRGISSYRSRSATLSYTRLEPLTDAEARRALCEPAAESGVLITAEALARAIDFCEGNPWLLQFVGETAWERAQSSPIGIEAMNSALAEVRHRLHESYFPRLLRRCTPEQRTILAAMAREGGTNVPVGTVRAPGPDGHDNEFINDLVDLAQQDFIQLHNNYWLFADTTFRMSFSTPGLCRYLQSATR